MTPTSKVGRIWKPETLLEVSSEIIKGFTPNTTLLARMRRGMPTATVSTDLTLLFKAAAGHFDVAYRTGPEVCRSFSIGDQQVQFRFADSRLNEVLTPAINHLECEIASEADLTIDVWQSPRSPIQMSQRQWSQSVSPLQSLGPHDFVYCQPDIGMLTLMRGNRALLCYRDIADLPPWELAIPFRVILNSWFQRFGGQIIHGAAIARAESAVILAGVGGSGKSSTALSCLPRADLTYISDDLCLLMDAGNPKVFSLYNTVKIRRENLSRFRDYQLDGLDHLPMDYGKPTFFLYPSRHEKIAHRCSVRAILLPRITHRSESSLRPATPSDAWRALVPSTFSVVMGDRAVTAELIRQSTRSLPVHWLQLGTDREQIAQVISSFLQDRTEKAA